MSRISQIAVIAWQGSSFALRHAFAIAFLAITACALWTLCYVVLLLWAIISDEGLGGPLAYPAGLLEQGSDLFVVRSVIDYHRSAEYDDEVDVCVRVARIGRSSMPFALEIWRGEDHLVSGEVVYVNADPQTRRSAPVPGGPA